MLSLTIKSVRANKARFFLTGIAVLLASSCVVLDDHAV